MRNIKRLFGVGTGVKPITSNDVEAAPQDPDLATQTDHAKQLLYNELLKLERHSVAVRKLLANDTLEVVAKPGKRK